MGKIGKKQNKKEKSMPEMPEVEIVVRGLKNKIAKRVITSCDFVENRDNVLQIPKSTMEFQELIKNKTIQSIERKGKYILFHLDEDYLLIFHLRMTGKLIIEDPSMKNDEKDRKYACVIFYLNDEKTLIFSDIRRFGTVYLIKKGEEKLITGLYNLGYEPLSEGFTIGYLKGITKTRNVPIKNFLLDQSKIAGLGNIYVDEALFLAKIHPTKKAKDLNYFEIENLHKSINAVILEGIKDGGTSFRDYKNAENKQGNHQNNLLVFRRQNQKCKTCDAIIEKIKLAGRGTHFCPKCQKL